MSNKYITMIRVRRDVVERLKSKGRKGESYSQVLERLIDRIEELEHER